MAVTKDEQDLLARLQTKLRQACHGYTDSFGRPQRGFVALDAYYDGMQRLEQLGLAVPAELRDFTTVVNWPGVVVDAIEERIDLEGFRLPGDADADDELWRVWQANDMDEESQMAHLDALVYGRSYVCVGTDPDDAATPLMTVESPLEMIGELDPRSRRLASAAKFYTDSSGGESVQRATLYLPDETIWLVSVDGVWVDDPDYPRDGHGLGVVPVEQLANAPRTARRSGKSHMLDAIGLTDAAARALTNAQVATEVMALPQRYAAGMSQADFTDPKTGETLTAWESYMGRIWGTANPDAKFGQFTAADLSNFTGIVSHYAQLIAGKYGLPLRYMGQSTTNPASADAIRAEDSRVNKTCERRSRAWSGPYERSMRTVRRIADGKWDPDLRQMETLWRDPATPTQAQAADAAVKLRQERILPLEATWENLGYSAVRRGKLRQQFEAEQADPILKLLATSQPGQAAQSAPVVDALGLPANSQVGAQSGAVPAAG